MLAFLKFAFVVLSFAGVVIASTRAPHARTAMAQPKPLYTAIGDESSPPPLLHHGSGSQPTDTVGGMPIGNTPTPGP